MIGDDHDQEQTEALREAYGWNLTDGTMTSFFLGGGRRPYLTGLIQNVNSNADAQPWIGCYWTSGLGTDELSASASIFRSIRTMLLRVNLFRHGTINEPMVCRFVA